MQCPTLIFFFFFFFFFFQFSSQIFNFYLNLAGSFGWLIYICPLPFGAVGEPEPSHLPSPLVLRLTWILASVVVAMAIDAAVF
ncbi:hypothetical protein ACN38_g8814 [Penicillium nordicum]|uniref:Uncharacterized protein n=1 Tax=Penicillium nordicum TaxID=229535 RepID=A0A0M9WD45_9EURO|nr:hypothetical protein ACN38_g8814 [Penicillium nordicum]